MTLMKQKPVNILGNVMQYIKRTICIYRVLAIPYVSCNIVIYFVLFSIFTNLNQII